MLRKLTLLGITFLVTFLIALDPTSAFTKRTDPACDGCAKQCGAASFVSAGTRSSEQCGGECHWVHCSAVVDGCGYGDANNDSCFWLGALHGPT